MNDASAFERSEWAIIAGASGGIGTAAAVAMRRFGIPIVGIDRTGSDEPLDLTNYSSVSGLIERLVITRGAPSAVIAAVGVYERRKLLDYDAARAETTLADNFLGVANLIRTVISMRSSQPLRIVLVTSQAGATGGADPFYAAAKSAMTAFGKSIAREFGDRGVRCNLVSPGPVDTPMADVMGDRRTYYEDTIPIRRFSRADEVAEVIAWLACEAPDAINGATFDVDGGLVRR